jgi:hypothetical protein
MKYWQLEYLNGEIQNITVREIMGVKEEADVIGIGHNLGNGCMVSCFWTICSVTVPTSCLNVSKSILLCSTDIVTHV